MPIIKSLHCYLFSMLIRYSVNGLIDRLIDCIRSINLSIENAMYLYHRLHHDVIDKSSISSARGKINLFYPIEMMSIISCCSSRFPASFDNRFSRNNRLGNWIDHRTRNNKCPVIGESEVFFAIAQLIDVKGRVNDKGGGKLWRLRGGFVPGEWTRIARMSKA